VLLALVGDVRPTFFSASVSEKNILKTRAVVTGVERNILRTVNNVPAVQYFASMGLVSGSELTGLQTMPMVVYLKDGSRLIRGVIAGADDGSASLCGSIPLHSTIALATMELDDVVRSTEDEIRAAAAAAAGKGVLIYSCAGRNWALGMRWTAEHDVVRKHLSAAHYRMVYSGGEIFPERLADGQIVNHLQNDSIIICVL
jgi:hypothetical protein